MAHGYLSGEAYRITGKRSDAGVEVSFLDTGQLVNITMEQLDYTRTLLGVVKVKLFTAFLGNGIANDLRCDVCGKSEVGVDSIMTYDAYGVGVDELCFDCASLLFPTLRPKLKTV